MFLRISKSFLFFQRYFCSTVYHTSSYIKPQLSHSVLSDHHLDLPDDLQAFLSSSQNSTRFIVSGYAKTYSLFEDVLTAASISNLPMSILILAYGAYDENYMNNIRHMLSTLDHKINVFLVEQTLNRNVFLALMNLFDVYIRSSGVDSYCYTISEAIDLGLLTIATSVCTRDHRTHFLYSPSDTSLLSMIITDIISSNSTMPLSPAVFPHSSVVHRPSVSCLLKSLVLS